MVHDPLDAWGDFDRDNPFALFAEVRGLGPVHNVTLADGHDAWLVVGHDEARSALNDPRLSKDMHAALARSGAVVAEGLPGPELARHMLAVDPPDHTRLRHLVSSAFSTRTVERLRPRVQCIVDRLLDVLAGLDPTVPADLVAAFAFPLPFTVICELLGVPEAERASLGRGLVAMLVPTPTPTDYARAKEASDAVVAQLRGLVVAKHEAPGDDLVSGLIAARDGDEQLDDQELLSTIFQLIVAGHDTTTSFIGNAVVALFDNPDAARAAARRSRPDPSGGGRAAPLSTPRYPTRRSATPSSPSRSATGRSRRGRRSSSASPPPTETQATTPIPTGSISSGPKRVTWRSGTGSITASVHPSPGSKDRSPCDRSSCVSRRSASVASVISSTGATATGSCCGACPSCRLSRVRRCRDERSPMGSSDGAPSSRRSEHV